MAKKASKKPNADEQRTIAAVEARLKKLRGQPLNRQQLRDLEWLEI